MDPIKTLESLEPVFIQAAQLALKMQKNAHHHNKFNSGNSAADIVTDADLAVQEFLLETISKTDLVNCRLLAEEDTPSVNKFNKEGKYYLGMDPIDGTAIYAKGGKHFSTIISLHDGKNVLYMFVHYPAFNWTHKVVNNKYSVFGQAPSFPVPAEAKNTILFWTGSPEKNMPELYKELTAKGLSFKKVLDFGEPFDSITMFTCDKIAGGYNENPNVYDGLVELSVALAKGYKVYTQSINGKFDLTNIQKREIGLYYPGSYLVLSHA